MPSGAAGNINLWPLIVSWLLIVLGWIIVHYLSVVRERRREILDLKDRIIERILDVEKCAIAFHQSEPFDPSVARDLMSLISRVSYTLAASPFNRFGLDRGLIVRFRRSITLRNFDATAFVTQAANSKVISNISVATEDLTSDLDRAYYDRYFAHWWQSFHV